MQSTENRAIIACSGSGKTTYLVREVLSRPECRVAMVTYTNNNAREIIKRFGELNGGVPTHVDVETWFSFALRNGARPYQRSLYPDRRIESIAFMNRQSARGVAKTDTRRYYFANGEAIYSDKISKFVVECETASGHRVTARLRQMYTDVFIDEFQDLAGWDLDLVEMLLQSGIRVTLVGDPRQHIYSTNPSMKNKQYLGIKVVALIQKWEKRGLCQRVARSGSYRCNQAICDFANGLWPGMDPMTSLTANTTEHDGMFLILESAVGLYLERFHPQILQYSKQSKSYGGLPLNFGMAKGLQFDRVLIVPTERIRKYLETGDPTKLDTRRGTSKDRLHVAVTRARHSVGFVYDDPSPVVPNRWHAGRRDNGRVSF